MTFMKEASVPARCLARELSALIYIMVMLGSAVARSTLHDEPSSLLQTRLHHHMAASTEGPRFDHVLLIVTRFHADKVLTLHSAYRPHFWDVVFLGPAAEMNAEEASNLRQQGLQVDDCSESLFDYGRFPCGDTVY